MVHALITALHSCSVLIPALYSCRYENIQKHVKESITYLNLRSPVLSRAHRELLLEFGYPRWMVPIIGILQLGIAISNFHDGGSWRFVGQKVLAVLMGGCIFSHAVQVAHIIYVSLRGPKPLCVWVCLFMMEWSK